MKNKYLFIVLILIFIGCEDCIKLSGNITIKDYWYQYHKFPEYYTVVIVYNIQNEGNIQIEGWEIGFYLLLNDGTTDLVFHKVRDINIQPYESLTLKVSKLIPVKRITEIILDELVLN